jgi:FkbM family methyltransferase
MPFVREQIKSLGRKLGVELRRYSAEHSEAPKLKAFFDRFGIDLVFDVGANTGQFARTIRAAGYAGRIVSFEPLSAAHRALCAHAAGDSLWQVHPRCALGDRAGEATINVSSNSASSSLLPILETSLRSAPESKFVGCEKTSVATLDGLYGQYRGGGERIFLKVDTQGFEKPVLDGAQACLPHVQGALLELSLVPLYEGQELWHYFVDYLGARGFAIWALIPGFSDPRTGQTLQVDAIFYRPAADPALS